MEWRRIRAEHLALESTCRDCGAPATQVDHALSLRRGGTNDHSNLRSLCHSCHSRKTANVDGGFGQK